MNKMEELHQTAKLQYYPEFYRNYDNCGQSYLEQSTYIDGREEDEYLPSVDS